MLPLPKNKLISVRVNENLYNVVYEKMQRVL
jgi:hypothetical protein